MKSCKYRISFTLLLLLRNLAFKESEYLFHLEISPLSLQARASFKVNQQSAMSLLIPLGAHLFFDSINVSSVGSAWGLMFRFRGFPFPGRFSKWLSSMDCQILHSTTLIILVSVLIKMTITSDCERVWSVWVHILNLLTLCQQSMYKHTFFLNDVQTYLTYDKSQSVKIYDHYSRNKDDHFENAHVKPKV